MIPIYICEDDKSQLKYLEKMINNIILMYELDMELAAACSSPECLLNHMNKNAAETAAYFLDIDLKAQMNGVELAVEIRQFDPRAFIIFVTAHDEMLRLTFDYKVECLDYILKDSSDISKRIREVLLNIQDKSRLPAEDIADTLKITIGKKVTQLRLDDIYYIESILNSHKVAIHTSHETIEYISTLKDIFDKLNDKFLQCHKAYIVNYQHIKILDRKDYMITFDNGQMCPCSTRLFSKLYKKFIK